MKQIIKNDEKTQKVIKKVKKGFKFYAMGVMLVAITVGTTTGVYAASDPLTVVNNLSNFIFSLTRAIGLIICGYYIYYWYQLHQKHILNENIHFLLLKVLFLLHLY